MNKDNKPTAPDSSEEDSPATNIGEVSSIPENVTVFHQTHWAWLLPSSIWIVLLLAVIIYDFISMGFIPLLMAVAIVVPRYLRWKQTKYYLSEEALYITMVGLPLIQKKRIFMLSFADIADMNLKYGTFGKTLGYAEVQVVVQNQQPIKLPYIGNYQDFMSYIESRTDLPGTP